MPTSEEPFVTTLTLRADAPVPPDRPADEVYGPVSLWRSGDELVLDGGRGLLAVIGPHGATIGGEVRAGTSAVAALRGVLHHVIAHLLGLHDRYVVHAAAVARDSGILVLGSTGQGKSTVGFAARDAGWRLLADDLVSLTTAPDVVLARGIHRAPAVPSDVVSGTGVRGRRLDGDARQRLLADVVLDDRSARITQVVLVGHDEGAGALLAADPRAVVEAVFSSFPSAGRPAVARKALQIAGTLSGMPAYRLLLPRVPAERLPAVSRLLDQVAAAA